MSENKREFEFSLTENITVAKDGEAQYCNKILLKAPNAKQNRERCLIKQAFLSSVNKVSEIKDNPAVNSLNSRGFESDQFGVKNWCQGYSQIS